MAKTLVGALRVTLGLDSAEFAQGAARVQKMSQDMAKKLTIIGTAVSAVGAGLAAAIRSQINAADDMGEVAQKLGVPVEALTALQHAAKITGVSMESLEGGLLRLSKGMENAPQKFADLGIAVRDVNGDLRPTADVLKEVADRFQSMPDGAAKTALAMELFGKSGADLIPMLNAGASGINGLMEEAKALGLVISQDTADAAGRFNENLDKLKATATGLAAVVAAHLAPVLERISGYLLELATAFQNLDPQTQKFMSWAAGLTIVLGPVLVGLGLVVGAIGALVTPFTLAAAAAVALGAAWYAMMPTMEELQRFWDNLGIIIDYVGQRISEFISGAIESLKTTFSDLWTSAVEVWEGIKTTIGGAIDYVVAKWDAFVGKLTAAIQVARDVGTAISEALSLGENGGGLGTQVTNGLVNGMNAGTPSAFNAGVNLGKAAGDGIRAVLGIQSPSTVAAGYGMNVAEGMANGIREGASLVGEAAASLSDTAATAMSGIDSLGKRVGDMFATAATNVLTGVTSLREAVGQLLQQLAQLLINSAMKSLFGNIFSGLNIGGYATGTASAAAGLAMVGEEGPELINFKGGERVYNARDTSRMMGGAGEGGGGPMQIINRVYLDGTLILDKLETVEGELAIKGAMGKLGYAG
jgi:phage-related protein